MKAAVLGTWHVHADEYTRSLIENPGSEVPVIWDSDIEKAKAFAEKHGVKEYTDDLDKVLSCPEIDSVAVCTATGEHPQVITAAARAGKNIFTEKVLAFTTEDAEMMKKVIDESGVKFTISYPHRTWGKVKFAKEVLDSGKLGKVSYARVRNVHAGASAGWLPPHFFDKEQCGGGAMMDLGAHPMYTLAYLMGEPVSISSTFTSVTGKAVEDNAVSVIEFKDGGIGVSETGFVSMNNPYTLELSGTEGALMVHGDTVSYCCPETEGKWVVEENLPENGQLPIHQWIDAVNNGTEAPFGTDDALMLTKFMDGAYKSFDSGKKYIY